MYIFKVRFMVNITFLHAVVKVMNEETTWIFYENIILHSGIGHRGVWKEHQMMLAPQNCSLNMQNFPFITLLGHKISIHPVCCLSVSLGHRQVAWEFKSWSLIWRITKSTWSLSSPLMSLARHKGEWIKPLNAPLRQLQSDSYSPSAQQSFGEELHFRRWDVCVRDSVLEWYWELFLQSPPHGHEPLMSVSWGNNWCQRVCGVLTIEHCEEVQFVSSQLHFLTAGKRKFLTSANTSIEVSISLRAFPSGNDVLY